MRDHLRPPTATLPWTTPMLHKSLLLGAVLCTFVGATRVSPPTRGADEFFPAATPESQGLRSDSLAALVAEVESYYQREMFVGAELLVIQNRRTVLHERFGHSDRDEGVAWEVGTVCNIRSMTKTLTGAAIQILADRGLLELDEPVCHFLPGFDSEASESITIRHLLTHRSGLPLTALTAIDEFESLYDLANAAGERGPQFPVNSKFWYSDAGTDVLGAVVEVVAEMPLDEFVQTELLEPLGMEQSFYYHDSNDPRRTEIASLYFGSAGNWQRIMNPDDGPFYPFAWGSQSLYSTPKDYAKFLAMWMDGGKVGDRVLLSEQAVARSLEPVSEMSQLGSDERFPTFFHGLEAFYGQMAVLHVPVEQAGAGPATIVGHSGSDGTIAWAWPERDLIVLFFTQSRGGLAGLRLERALQRFLLGGEVATAEAPVPDALRPCLGTYIADWGSHMKEAMEVAWRSGSLVLDIPTQMEFELVPAEEDGRWHFGLTSEVTVWFDHDESGAVESLRIEQGGLTFEAPRQGSARLAELTEENRSKLVEVSKFLGRYRDPSTGDVLSVFVDGDYLAIRREEQPPAHLWRVPQRSVWQVRENPVISLTFQEVDAEVVSLTLQSPGGKASVMPRTAAESPAANMGDAEEAVFRVLDSVHAAHANGNADQFFRNFAHDAVLFGTAPGERWNLEEYRAFSADAFARQVSRPREILTRHIVISDDASLAWFDERQRRAGDLELRSSGVLRHDDGQWQLVQFRVALPLPNELVPEYEAMLVAHRAIHAEPTEGSESSVADPDAELQRRNSAAAELSELDVARAGALQALERFHRAVTEADLETYIDSWCENGVLLGTAADERKDLDALTAFVEPYFARGQGSPRTALERNVFVAGSGKLAWFDEWLDNAQYPDTVATGVLLEIDGHWRLAHFVLAFPVPNEFLEDLLPRIRETTR